MWRNSIPVFIAKLLSVGLDINKAINGSQKKKNAIKNGNTIHIASVIPDQKPFFIRSSCRAPIFCAVKLDNPFARVVKEVIAIFFYAKKD
mgnify:CR=1 FL=1